jgi:hypothetical protein
VDIRKVMVLAFHKSMFVGEYDTTSTVVSGTAVRRYPKQSANDFCMIPTKCRDKSVSSNDPCKNPVPLDQKGASQ